MRRGAVLVAALGVFVAGCGSQVTGAPAPLAVVDASRVDMCTVLTDAELTVMGIKLDTRKPIDELGLVGCGWLGKPFTLSLERDRDTVAAYQARRHDPAFTSFADNTINGRAGARLSVERDRTDCTQLMDGGSVSLSVSVAPSFSLNPAPFDSCAEALRIAQMIEPRLPKAGS
ncbi:MAG: DUF3558 family protein [Pseudonocardiaceae bacterium]